LLFLVFFTMIIPMANVLAVSFSTRLGSMEPGIILWPRNLSVEGYVTIWQRANLSRAFSNSSFVSVVATFIQVILSALAGYVLVQRICPSKRPFPL